ncbi:MAG TPA: HXXEE domain-containing protein [Candidatus Angelobacter sp.]
MRAGNPTGGSGNARGIVPRVIVERRVQLVFLCLILSQAAHSVEEYVTRLYDMLASARFISSLISNDLARGFLVANVVLVAVGLWCWAVPVRSGWRSARGVAWFWTVLELGNGVSHLFFALLRGGYFPGAGTAPLLLLFAGWLAVLQARQGKNHSTIFNLLGEYHGEYHYPAGPFSGAYCSLKLSQKAGQAGCFVLKCRDSGWASAGAEFKDGTFTVQDQEVLLHPARRYSGQGEWGEENITLIDQVSQELTLQIHNWGPGIELKENFGHRMILKKIR